MTTVRLADKEADFAIILECAIRFAASSGLAEFLPDSVEDFATDLKATIDAPNVVVYLAERNGVVVGGLGLIYTSLVWNRKKAVVDELFFWVAPSAPPTVAMRLLKTATSAAKESANFLMLHALTTSPAKVADVYVKMGLRPIQLTFLGAV